VRGISRQAKVLALPRT